MLAETRRYARVFGGVDVWSHHAVALARSSLSVSKETGIVSSERTVQERLAKGNEDILLCRVVRTLLVHRPKYEVILKNE